MTGHTHSQSLTDGRTLLALLLLVYPLMGSSGIIAGQMVVTWKAHFSDSGEFSGQALLGILKVWGRTLGEIWLILCYLRALCAHPKAQDPSPLGCGH